MLWCLVNEPNGVIHELNINKKANGHECFDKVMYCLYQGKPKDKVVCVSSASLASCTRFSDVLMYPFLQVCERLRLYEKDYFGLKCKGPKGSEIWLNLRNPLAGQVHGKPPYRFLLLVKYFVKPQELQQEITR